MTDVVKPAHTDIRGCEICGRERQVYVRCCSFGAMSLAYCQECLEKGAEPEFGFAYLWDWVADRNREALAAHVSELFCWKDGRYWTWDEWVDNELANPRPWPEYPEPEYPDENTAPEVDFTALGDLGFDVQEAKSDES